jgi:hypothetical protein
LRTATPPTEESPWESGAADRVRLGFPELKARVLLARDGRDQQLERDER